MQFLDAYSGTVGDSRRTSEPNFFRQHSVCIPVVIRTRLPALLIVGLLVCSAIGRNLILERVCGLADREIFCPHSGSKYLKLGLCSVFVTNAIP